MVILTTFLVRYHNLNIQRYSIIKEKKEEEEEFAKKLNTNLLKMKKLKQSDDAETI